MSSRCLRIIFLFLLSAFPLLSVGQSEQLNQAESKLRKLLGEENYSEARDLQADYGEAIGEDSERQAEHIYLKAIIHYARDEYAQSTQTLRQALLSQSNPYLEYKIRSLLVQNFQQDYALDSMKWHLNALEELEDYSDSLSQAFNYFAHYFVHYRGGDKDIALLNIQEARDYMAALGDMRHAATFDSYIGRLYQDLDQDSLAQFYQDRALEYLMNHGHHDKASYVLLERGSYYNGRGDFEKAELDLSECLRLSEETGNLANIANASQFISSAYVEMGRYNEAEDALNRSMQICDELDVQICRVYAHMYYAHLYLESGDVEKAIFHASALSNQSRDEFPSEVREGLEYLAEAQAMAGQFELAYRAKYEEKRLADSLFSSEKEAAMGHLREQYERERTQTEMKEWKAQAAMEKRQAYFLMIGLVLVTLFAGLAINQEVKRRRKAKALHETELELERIEKLRLEESLAHKNRELTAKALHIAQKNEVLQKLQNDLQKLAREKGADECVREVVGTLKLERSIDRNWEQFIQQFTELNPEFYKNITEVSGKLSRSDLRLAALLRMNMSSKEIASMLNISDEGIKKARYRLRKKLELRSEDSLEARITAF